MIFYFVLNFKLFDLLLQFQDAVSRGIVCKIFYILPQNKFDLFWFIC